VQHKGSGLYNYLMSAGGWEPHRDTISPSRFNVGAQHPQFEFVDGVAPPALLALPALFMPEVDETKNQTARVVTITSARIRNRLIHLEYSIDAMIPPISVGKIVQLANELDIATGGFALQHTHWTVRDADLFRVLLRNEVTKAPQPTVFKLNYDNRDENLVGVMMPFEAGFTPVYKAIKAATTAAGFQCKRADDIWRHPQVMQTIVSLICEAGIVVVDCSNRNPNVFYEAGIAHTLGRDVILLAQRIDDVPFDLRHLHIVDYLPNKQGLKELTKKLKDRIEAVSQAHSKS
jgi:hypothetical protein